MFFIICGRLLFVTETHFEASVMTFIVMCNCSGRQHGVAFTHKPSLKHSEMLIFMIFSNIKQLLWMLTAFYISLFKCPPFSKLFVLTYIIYSIHKRISFIIMMNILQYKFL